MPMQRYKPEQIVTLLRQIEVAVASGRRRRWRARKPGLPRRRTIAGGRSRVG